MSDDKPPTNWHDLGPAALWGILLLGAGLEAVTALVHGEWAPFYASCLVFVVLAAMLIQWPQIKMRLEDPRWIAAAAMTFLLCLALSPFVEEKRLPFSIWFATHVSEDQLADAKAQQTADDQKQIPDIQRVARATQLAEDQKQISSTQSDLRSATSAKEIAERQLTEAQETIATLKNASTHSLLIDTTTIADLNKKLENLRAQSVFGSPSVPLRLLNVLGSALGDARTQQLTLSAAADEKMKAEQEKNTSQLQRFIFPSYFVPPCRIIVSSTNENKEFARAIEAIAQIQGCSAEDSRPPPPPRDADSPALVIPSPAPYVVVRYPKPDDIETIPETQMFAGMHAPIPSEEINKRAAKLKDQIADKLMTAFQNCGLDARRSHKVEGNPGWPVEKWTIYIDLGNAQICK